MNLTKLAVSVVVYDSDQELLREVLKSLETGCRSAQRNRQLTVNVDVVNNRPADDRLQALAEIADSASSTVMRVWLINAGRNGGYGAGNNLSIRRRADADVHLVLNPDVLIQEDAISNALDYLDLHPDVGLLTPQVRGIDGSLHHLCKRHPTLLDMFIRSASSPLLNRWFADRAARYEMRDHDYGRVIRPVPYPTGCFMLFRRAVLDRIGGFDEGFFLHYEDADIGRQVSLVSQTAYVPTVVVQHKWSRETHKSWRMRWITIKSGLRYWRKWGGIA